ncbi:hypothetical protein AB7U53_001564, partial [Campylobacter upsaliensis]
MQQFSQTLTHGGGGVTPALKGFTLFSCSSLIFTGLLTVDLNAQTITITNNNRFINNKHYNKTLIVNSHLNTGRYSDQETSLGLYFTNIQKLDIQQGATIDSWLDTQNITINQMDISGQTAGFLLRRDTKITTLDLKSGGRIHLMYMFNNVSIDTLNIEGTLTGWSRYSSYAGLNNQGGKINTINVKQGGKIEQGVRNSGTIQTLTINNGTINGGITNNSRINNGINITNSTINGSIVNSGANASTGNISITETSHVSGNIVNQNGANFNNQITLDQNSKLGGISNTQGSTMSGQLDLKGEVGTITNAGQFDSTLTLSNKVGEINNAEGGTISNDITINNGGSVGTLANGGTMQNITIQQQGKVENITNSGTMQAITNNATTGTLTLTNSGGTIDKVTNGNGATATIRNQGKITNGIINDGGTLTVFNDFRKDESAANGYHTIGEIGKTANGVHIENNNGGKLHLNAWYFNKEDFTTQEERKANALLVDGDYANISLENAFVSTHNLDVDETYDAYSLIADKNGNMIGDKINNGQGIDINKLYSVSGIYTFENYGGKGR